MLTKCFKHTFCTRYETSEKTIFPTFARTRPPDVHISKSVASVLMSFQWKKVAFLYSSAKELDFYWIADTIVKTLEVCGIKVILKKTWDVTYHHGYLDNPFLQLVEETFEDAR
uniref:Receptor ligand binding region domain-containing protein n=1 Tax=Strigamia maritima TaxID=126957 RepID=T1INP4_STRMM